MYALGSTGAHCKALFRRWLADCDQERALVLDSAFPAANRVSGSIVYGDFFSKFMKISSSSGLEFAAFAPRDLAIEEKTTFELIMSLEADGWHWQQLPARKKLRLAIKPFKLGDAKVWYSPRLVPDHKYMKCLLLAEECRQETYNPVFGIALKKQTTKLGRVAHSRRSHLRAASADHDNFAGIPHGFPQKTYSEFLDTRKVPEAWLSGSLGQEQKKRGSLVLDTEDGIIESMPAAGHARECCEKETAEHVFQAERVEHQRVLQTGLVEPQQVFQVEKVEPFEVCEAEKAWGGFGIFTSKPLQGPKNRVSGRKRPGAPFQAENMETAVAAMAGEVGESETADETAYHGLESALAELMERTAEELDADGANSDDERTAEELDANVADIDDGHDVEIPGTGGALDETMLAPLAPEISVDEEAASYVHLRVRKRGGFTFTPKQGRGQGGTAGTFGGIQASCPWHARNDKTGCRKFMSMTSGSPQARLEVMRQLCYWCIHGHNCDRQRLHLTLHIPDATATPSLRTMWDMLGDMDSPAERCQTDLELDAQEEAVPKRAARKAKAKAKTERAQPKKRQRTSVASVALPASQSSSSSSTSSSSSSSS
eukprot:6480128-Amphidinium_carterae.8